MTTNVVPGQPAHDTPPLLPAEDEKPARAGSRTTREEIKSEEPPLTLREQLDAVWAEINPRLKIKKQLEAEKRDLLSEIERLNPEVTRLERAKATESEIRKCGRALGDAITRLERVRPHLFTVKAELSPLFERMKPLQAEVERIEEKEREQKRHSDHRDREAMARMDHAMAKGSGKKCAKQPSPTELKEVEIKETFRAGLISKAQMREQIKEVRRAAKHRRMGQANPDKPKKKDKDSKKAEKKTAKHAA